MGKSKAIAIALPFARYRFTFKAHNALTLPEYSGTLWHSVVGNALYEMSCIVPESTCHDCLFKQRCDYALLFRGIKPAHSNRMGNCNTIPTPHIFRVEQAQHYTINAEQTFSVTLILLGNANKRLASLIRAMQKVGDNGFHHARKKARLIQVSQIMPTGIDKQIPLQTPQTKEAQIGLPHDYPPPTDIPKKLQLRFLTPFRSPSKVAGSTDFIVDRFVMGLIRRISALQYFYTGQFLDVDYAALKKLTRQLPVLQHTMQQQRNGDLEKRKNQHQQGRLWVGSIDLDLEQHQALWPYLYLGQWLNTGKNASMGFGCYELIDLT